MSFRDRFLLPVLAAGLLLMLAACTSLSSLPVVTATPAPVVTPTDTPVPPMPGAWGAAVLEQAADGANLKLLASADRPLVYESYDTLSSDLPDAPPAVAVLAQEESTDSPGSYVLYTALTITNATAWHEYAWFAAENGSEGHQILLSQGLPISRVVTYTLENSDGTLNGVIGALHMEQGLTPSQTRRLLLRDADGKYQLVLLECPLGADCEGSPSIGDQFCNWCKSCSQKWCKSCYLVCP